MPRPHPAHLPSSLSSLSASFDTLMRRIEHAATLRERQVAVDTLFDSRRSDDSTIPPTRPPVTRRNLP